MSTKNKKSVAAQALLEMDNIISEIKEESKKSLNVMLAEAVKQTLREGCCDEDDEDYEVMDDEDKNDADDKEGKSKKSSTSDIDEDENDEMEGGAPQQPAMQQNAADNGMAAAQTPMGAQDASTGAEAGEQPTDGAEDGAEEWNAASNYQVGDDTYDLTGEKDYNQVVKVYKLLQDDDELVVKTDGNTVKLQDNGAGTEYLIDLGDDDEDASAESVEGEEEMPTDGLNEAMDIADIAGQPNDDEFDFEVEPDEEEDDNVFRDIDTNWEDNDYDDEDFDSDSLDGEEMNNFTFESKKTRKPMKESKEVLFEVDLGYTDNYQDKDPIKGLSNNEPSKSGKSWHKGVPTGTSKPWAGETKSKGDPFKTTQKVEGSVNEEEFTDDFQDPGVPEEVNNPLEEAGRNVGGFVQQNTTPGSVVPNSNGRKARSQRGATVGTKVTGTADPRYSSAVTESKELKAIKKENKELKEAVIALRKNLNEAYITNVNLGKITKLFLENTTSQAEKIDIVNRFSNEAKTVEQSKALYESINRELKKTNSNPMNINETSVTANGTKALNEDKVYKSDDLLKTIDFMNRVLNY